MIEVLYRCVINDCVRILSTNISRTRLGVNIIETVQINLLIVLFVNYAVLSKYTHVNVPVSYSNMRETNIKIMRSLVLYSSSLRYILFFVCLNRLGGVNFAAILRRGKRYDIKKEFLPLCGKYLSS